jgi:CubicO group peptidase (beta-lactamase class C family)
LLIAKGGKVLLNNAYGNAGVETIFDAASLTKPICTTTLVMQLAVEDKIRLDDPVCHHLKEFEHKGVTIRHLLNHSSGLPAWQAYYQTVPNADIGRPAGKKEILESIFHEPLEYVTASRSVYSDLGFIMLGEIIERVLKKPLDRLFAERVAKPLGLTNTFFISLHDRTIERSHDRTSFAPTEDCPWRKKVMRGEVHDQNCYAMGGVAGHAGLFSTTTDINKFITALVASYKGESPPSERGPSPSAAPFLPQEIVQRFLPFHYKLTEVNTTWLLGWDTPAHTNSQAGQYYSKRSIGHLGYTGCSMWLDLEQDYWIVLLTNRIHPTTTNEKIRSFRPTIYNMIYEEMLS